MNNTTIMVQMAETKWTWAALYEACRLARETGASVTLVKFVPVEYLAWFADSISEYTFSEGETEDIRSYRAIADEHDVTCAVSVFQYVDLPEALIRAADALNASHVFATLPHHLFGWQDRREVNRLSAEMQQRQHDLHVVATPAVLS